MDKIRSTDPAELRRRAEEQLRNQASSTSEQADQDLARLVTELQVHQVELEMQNEELQQARDEIEAGLRRYTDLYDFAPIGYFTLDRDGLILQVNLTGATMLGVERLRLMKRRLAGFISDESRPTFDAFLAEVFVSDAREVCEVVLQGRDHRSIHVRFEAVVAEDGKSCRAVVLDITDRKQAEALAAARQKDEQARLAALETSAAKDRFLAVLSHELRTPLMPVLAAISMLQRQPGWDRRTQEMLSTARRNVEMEARLVDDLLDLMRISKSKLLVDKHPIDLCSVVGMAIDVCRPDIEGRGVKMSVDLGTADCTVEGDAARIQQVIWNLLSNAVKFTPKGGRVEIRCRPEQGQAVVEIRDSGVGIEPRTLGRIFDAFEQGAHSTTRQFGGLGLGLSISKSLVEMHGGSIEAYSEGQGKGATFTVRLPLTSMAAAPARATDHPADQSSEAPGQRRLKVLLVEDHGDTAEMLEYFLCSEGYQVYWAANTATALDAASRDSFDLLISDLGLPDRSGIELMRELRARGHTLPGIALSGYGQDKDVRQSLDAGFAAHICKPVDVERLLNELREVVASRAGLGAQQA